MFTSIVICIIGMIAAILYSAFEAEVHAFMVARMATAGKKEESLLDSKRLPNGTMAAWEEMFVGMECQLHHDYPMYWPSSK
jgi:hypothetical protein